MKPITASALRVLEDFGLPPVPCDDNKRPIEQGWTAKVYRDYPSVEEAFERTPAKLVGVLTGLASGQFVLDVDPTGAQWFAEHLADLQPGLMYTTRRANGRHLWYRVPAGWNVVNSASKLASGIDTRGTGGQAIWWPEHGGTILADDGPRDPSTWLLAELERAGAAERIGEKKKSAVPQSADGRRKQGEGGRNDMLTRRAGSMRRAGFSIEAMREALHKENYVSCEPALPGAEVEAILTQAEKWDSNEEQGAQEAATAAIPRTPLSWLDLKTKEPPARQWVIPHWIPAGHLTLLAGRGGVGKTLLAQHLGSAIALGRDYLEPIEPKRVLMWACEDDHDELWRRQIAINNLLATPFDQLDGKFILHSYAGVDVTLMAPSFGALEPRPMLKELASQVADYKADIVLLDNIARLYGGNENERHQVTTFCALVQGACSPAAVVLIGHPAKQAGSEFSGSTAWEGAVRARLYFSDRMPDAAPDDDAPIDDKVRYLSRRKANYSALDLRRFILDNGILIPESIEIARSQSVGVSGDYAKEIVRRAIRTLAERGIFGGLGTGTANYLPKLAKQYGLLDRATDKQFGAVMRAMILEGTIASEKVGTYSNRTDKFGIVLK